MSRRLLYDARVSRALAAALTVGAVLWVALLFIAPSRPRCTLSAATYIAASFICHQQSARSFHLSDAQMPVCARCAGLYVSGAIGALLGWVFVARIGTGARRVLLLTAAVPTALTWGLEVLGIVPFSNAVRAFAALPLGLFAGWVFVLMLRYDAPLDGEQIHSSGTHARSV